MSIFCDKYSSLLAVRIKEERKRLGLSQEKTGIDCGVSREMWGKYERGVSVPGGDVLFSFAAIGADINYIMKGVRTLIVNENHPGYTLRPDQKALLDNVEHCSKEDQDAIKRMALLAARAIDTDETQQQELKKQANGD